MKTSTPHVNIKHTSNAKSDKTNLTPMSELDKMEECRAKDMNLYQSSKPKPDWIQRLLREFTLAEIKSSVVEAGTTNL